MNRSDLCVVCGRGVSLPHSDFCAGIKDGSRKFSVPCKCGVRFVPKVSRGWYVPTCCPRCERKQRLAAA